MSALHDWLGARCPCNVPDGSLSRGGLLVGTLGLMALATLGYYLAVPLFFGVDLVFGSIAVLVAVSRLGLIPGVLVAVVGGLYTLTLWGHPYALVIFVVEALFVGWLLRRGWFVVLADIVFWLALGIPLVVVFYGGIMDLGVATTSLIALKQSVNGIFNAVVASFMLLAIQLPAVARRLGLHYSLARQLTLRNLLFSLLIAALLLPGMVFIASEGRYHRDHMEEDLANRMSLAASLIASELAAAPDSRVDVVQAARLRMAETHGLSFAFLDNEGRVVAGALKVGLESGVRLPALANGVRLLAPAEVVGPAMQRMDDAVYLHQAVVPGHPEVTRVVAQADAAPLMARLQHYHIRQLTGLALFAVLAALGAAVVSRWLTRPLEELNRISEDLPERIMEGTVTAPHLPRSGFAEFSELTQAIRRLALAMASGFNELRGTRDNLERIVAERTRALERNNEELRRLAEIAAHHLMEPLRRVMAYTQRLQKNLPMEVTDSRDWQRVEEQVGRMASLVEDLQRYLAHQTLAPEQARVDLNLVVHNALAALPQADGRGPVPLRVTLEPDPLPAVDGDSSELIEVFRQLLANVVAYALPGQEAAVTIRVSEEPLGWLVEVQDQGRGFDPVYAERIFRLFERLYPERDVPGTGLGLALVRRVVENHGGWVGAESAGLDQGATIRFLLPERFQG